MESNVIMCAPGYPASGAAAASKGQVVVHQVKAAAFTRDRVVTNGVAIPQIVDLPSDVSAMTSERRT